MEKTDVTELEKQKKDLRYNLEKLYSYKKKIN